MNDGIRKYQKMMRELKEHPDRFMLINGVITRVKE